MVGFCFSTNKRSRFRGMALGPVLAQKGDVARTQSYLPFAACPHNWHCKASVGHVGLYNIMSVERQTKCKPGTHSLRQLCVNRKGFPCALELSFFALNPTTAPFAPQSTGVRFFHHRPSDPTKPKGAPQSGPQTESRKRLRLQGVGGEIQAAEVLGLQRPEALQPVAGQHQLSQRLSEVGGCGGPKVGSSTSAQILISFFFFFGGGGWEGGNEKQSPIRSPSKGRLCSSHGGTASVGSFVPFCCGNAASVYQYAVSWASMPGARPSGKASCVFRLRLGMSVIFLRMCARSIALTSKQLRCYHSL